MTKAQHEERGALPLRQAALLVCDVFDEKYPNPWGVYKKALAALRAALSEAEPALVTLASLHGAAPNLTGGLSSGEYIRRIRAEAELAPEPVDNEEFLCGCFWFINGERCSEHMATEQEGGKWEDGGGPLSDLELYTKPPRAPEPAPEPIAPFAWAYRHADHSFGLWTIRREVPDYATVHGYEILPLYTEPPRAPEEVMRNVTESLPTKDSANVTAPADRTSAEAQPCPFCGSQNLTLYDERVTPRVVFIFCQSCEMHGPEATTVDAAREAWNARVPPRAPEGSPPVAVCAFCGLRKKPIGRDAPAIMANSLCDHECPGYDEDPQPGSLWPGEASRAPEGVTNHEKA